MMIPAPPGKEYLPYQLKGIRYALGGRGTLFADEMGLGKTVEAIGVINALSNGRNDLNVVIICPAFLRLNWHIELDEWMVNSCKVDVISYHQAGALALEARTNRGLPGSIDVLIIDEAHYIKNPDAQRTKDVTEIAQYATKVLALTGTPAENCPIELWSILKVVCPEKWNRETEWPAWIMGPDRKKSHPGEGPSFWRFAERYCNLRYVEYVTRSGTHKALDFGGASNLDELAGLLRKTCMVRRLKRDVLQELPDKRRQLIVLPSTSDDSDLFPGLDDDSYFDVLRRLTEDKVAFHEWSKRRHEQALAKVDASIRFIGDALEETRKLIVFAHHQDVIDVLRDGIGCEIAANERVVSITGKTPMAERQQSVDCFQNDPSCRVIVGSLGAMGVGFTLTAADHVICVELDPVPGRMTQAEDRAHRIGQRKSLLVQHLVANGSLCARIARILVRKQAVLSRLLDKGSAGLVYRESSENDGLP